MCLGTVCIEMNSRMCLGTVCIEMNSRMCLGTVCIEMNSRMCLGTVCIEMNSRMCLGTLCIEMSCLYLIPLSFILALGCPNMHINQGMYAIYTPESKLTVKCNYSSETWYYTCVGREWNGMTLGNCSNFVSNSKSNIIDAFTHITMHVVHRKHAFNNFNKFKRIS